MKPSTTYGVAPPYQHAHGHAAGLGSQLNALGLAGSLLNLPAAQVPQDSSSSSEMSIREYLEYLSEERAAQSGSVAIHHGRSAGVVVPTNEGVGSATVFRNDAAPLRHKPPVEVPAGLGRNRLHLPPVDLTPQLPPREQPEVSKDISLVQRTLSQFASSVTSSTATSARDGQSKAEDMQHLLRNMKRMASAGAASSQVARSIPTEDVLSTTTTSSYSEYQAAAAEREQRAREERVNYDKAISRAEYEERLEEKKERERRKQLRERQQTAQSDDLAEMPSHSNLPKKRSMTQSAGGGGEDHKSSIDLLKAVTEAASHFSQVTARIGPKIFEFSSSRHLQQMDQQLQELRGSESETRTQPSFKHHELPKSQFDSSVENRTEASATQQGIDASLVSTQGGDASSVGLHETSTFSSAPESKEIAEKPCDGDHPYSHPQPIGGSATPPVSSVPAQAERRSSVMQTTVSSAEQPQSRPLPSQQQHPNPISTSYSTTTFAVAGVSDLLRTSRPGPSRDAASAGTLAQGAVAETPRQEQYRVPSPIEDEAAIEDARCPSISNAPDAASNQSTALDQNSTEVPDIGRVPTQSNEPTQPSSTPETGNQVVSALPNGEAQAAAVDRRGSEPNVLASSAAPTPEGSTNSTHLPAQSGAPASRRPSVNPATSNTPETASSASRPPSGSAARRGSMKANGVAFDHRSETPSTTHRRATPSGGSAREHAVESSNRLSAQLDVLTRDWQGYREALAMAVDRIVTTQQQQQQQLQQQMQHHLQLQQQIMQQQRQQHQQPQQQQQPQAQAQSATVQPAEQQRSGTPPMEAVSSTQSQVNPEALLERGEASHNTTPLHTERRASITSDTRDDSQCQVESTTSHQQPASFQQGTSNTSAPSSSTSTVDQRRSSSFHISGTVPSQSTSGSKPQCVGGQGSESTRASSIELSAGLESSGNTLVDRLQLLLKKFEAHNAQISFIKEHARQLQMRCKHRAKLQAQLLHKQIDRLLAREENRIDKAAALVCNEISIYSQFIEARAEDVRSLHQQIMQRARHKDQFVPWAPQEVQQLGILERAAAKEAAKLEAALLFQHTRQIQLEDSKQDISGPSGIADFDYGSSQHDPAQDRDRQEAEEWIKSVMSNYQLDGDVGLEGLELSQGDDLNPGIVLNPRRACKGSLPAPLLRMSGAFFEGCGLNIDTLASVKLSVGNVHGSHGAQQSVAESKSAHRSEESKSSAASASQAQPVLVSQSGPAFIQPGPGVHVPAFDEPVKPPVVSVQVTSATQPSSAIVGETAQRGWNMSDQEVTLGLNASAIQPEGASPVMNPYQQANPAQQAHTPQVPQATQVPLMQASQTSQGPAAQQAPQMFQAVTSAMYSLQPQRHEIPQVISHEMKAPLYAPESVYLGGDMPTCGTRLPTSRPVPMPTPARVAAAVRAEFAADEPAQESTHSQPTSSSTTRHTQRQTTHTKTQVKQLVSQLASTVARATSSDVPPSQPLRIVTAPSAFGGDAPKHLALPRADPTYTGPAAPIPTLPTPAEKQPLNLSALHNSDSLGESFVSLQAQHSLDASQISDRRYYQAGQRGEAIHKRSQPSHSHNHGSSKSRGPQILKVRATSPGKARAIVSSSRSQQSSGGSGLQVKSAARLERIEQFRRFRELARQSQRTIGEIQSMSKTGSTLKDMRNIIPSKDGPFEAFRAPYERQAAEAQSQGGLWNYEPEGPAITTQAMSAQAESAEHMITSATSNKVIPVASAGSRRHRNMPEVQIFLPKQPPPQHIQSQPQEEVSEQPMPHKAIIPGLPATSLAPTAQMNQTAQKEAEAAPVHDEEEELEEEGHSQQSSKVVAVGEARQQTVAKKPTKKPSRSIKVTAEFVEHHKRLALRQVPAEAPSEQSSGNSADWSLRFGVEQHALSSSSSSLGSERGDQATARIEKMAAPKSHTSVTSTTAPNPSQPTSRPQATAADALASESNTRCGDPLDKSLLHVMDLLTSKLEAEPQNRQRVPTAAASPTSLSAFREYLSGLEAETSNENI